MAITWNAIELYSNTNRINAAVVARCITVMKNSAMVHADRDFPSGFDAGRDEGDPIEGYGRTSSEDVVVTKLHRVYLGNLPTR